MLKDAPVADTNMLETEYQNYVKGESNKYEFLPTSSYDHIGMEAGDDVHLLIRRPLPYTEEAMEPSVKQSKAQAAEPNKAKSVKESKPGAKALASEPNGSKSVKESKPGAKAKAAKPNKSTNLASSPTNEANPKESTKKKPVSPTSASSPVLEREICPVFLRDKKCKFGDGCRKFHTECPYQWQYVLDFESTEWRNFSKEENTEFEEWFCDPATNSLPDRRGYVHITVLYSALIILRVYLAVFCSILQFWPN